jgi:hypothetical protein
MSFKKNAVWYVLVGSCKRICIYGGHMGRRDGAASMGGRERKNGEPAGARDEPVPVAAQGQSC